VSFHIFLVKPLKFCLRPHPEGKRWRHGSRAILSHAHISNYTQRTHGRDRTIVHHLHSHFAHPRHHHHIHIHNKEGQAKREEAQNRKGKHSNATHDQQTEPLATTPKHHQHYHGKHGLEPHVLALF